jgi:hypothetical protein
MSSLLPEATHLAFGLFADWEAVIASSSARIVPCVTQYYCMLSMHVSHDKCRELLSLLGYLVRH